jgi:hypothetical protein
MFITIKAVSVEWKSSSLPKKRVEKTIAINPRYITSIEERSAQELIAEGCTIEFEGAAGYRTRTVSCELTVAAVVNLCAAVGG